MKGAVTDIKFYGENGAVTSECIAICFRVPLSTGSTTYNNCVVNGYEITPGNELSISQSEGWIDKTKYEFSFSGSDTNTLYVIRVIPEGC